MLLKQTLTEPWMGFFWRYDTMTAIQDQEKVDMITRLGIKLRGSSWNCFHDQGFVDKVVRWAHFERIHIIHTSLHVNE